MIDIYLKHSIYSLCIDILFKELSKNMLVSHNKVQIGNRYSKIIDTDGITYFNCVIVSPETVSYFDDLEESDQMDMAISFIYESAIDSFDEVVSTLYNEMYYYKEEVGQLIFIE